MRVLREIDFSNLYIDSLLVLYVKGNCASKEIDCSGCFIYFFSELLLHFKTTESEAFKNARNVL